MQFISAINVNIIKWEFVLYKNKYRINVWARKLHALDLCMQQNLTLSIWEF
jgi:hypothetical protein